MVNTFVHENVKDYKKLLEEDSKNVDLINSRSISREEYRMEYNRIHTVIKTNISPITLEVYNRCSDTLVKEDKLEEILNKEAEMKYRKLIDSITSYVGNIQDISNLKIAQNGNLNGIVSGDSGKAKVETIGAGGYNIQCYHFRTLIHAIN